MTVKCTGCGSVVDKSHDNLRAKKSSGCRTCTNAKRLYISSLEKRLSKVGNSARDRCVNKNNPQYENYGGRGITFDFVSIEEYVQHVLTLEHPVGKDSIDRIDNNKGYTTGNLRWADMMEQSRNSRRMFNVVYENETMCFTDFVTRYTDVSGTRARILYNKGYTLEEITKYKPANRGRRASRNFRSNKLRTEKSLHDQ